MTRCPALEVTVGIAKVRFHCASQVLARAELEEGALDMLVTAEARHKERRQLHSGVAGARVGIFRQSVADPQ